MTNELHDALSDVRVQLERNDREGRAHAPHPNPSHSVLVSNEDMQMILAHIDELTERRETLGRALQRLGVGGAICTHGASVLVMHIHDAEPCSDFFVKNLGSPPPSTERRNEP